MYYNKEEWKINVDTNVLEFQAEDEWKSVFVNSKALWDIDESFINHNWCEVRKLDKQVAVHVTHNESVEERGCYLKIYAKTSSAIAPVIVTIKQAGILMGNTACPDDHHPHAIDLGLPSGTKWCCCNVGAASPEQYGTYFQWGNLPVGVPNRQQAMELINNCSTTWSTYKGVKGRFFVGPNGNKIFLPATGYKWGSDIHDVNVGGEGNYWTTTQSSTDSERAYELEFNSSNVFVTPNGVKTGYQTIRLVQ